MGRMREGMEKKRYDTHVDAIDSSRSIYGTLWVWRIAISEEQGIIVEKGRNITTAIGGLWWEELIEE